VADMTIDTGGAVFLVIVAVTVVGLYYAAKW
jgi:hypothetical protein